MERGEWQKGDWSDQERLEALAKYLPIFTTPGFKFSEVVPAKRQGDVTEMGWTDYGPEAQAFMQDAYDYGWVQSTNWTEWMQTDEAQALSQDPARMATANIDDLARVLTVSLRRDKFMEGSLADDFERGLITRVLKRAHELSAEAGNRTMEKKRTKTEAELIATVANVPDAEGCLLFAQRAIKEGMPALAAACEERAKTLKPFKAPGAKKTARSRRKTTEESMKTHTVAEQAFPMLVEDYKAGLPPTTYGDLAQRCGLEGQRNARWFGQVTDLIDAACALAGVPSFALVRVREANGNVNNAAWRKEYSYLRDRIIARALAGVWTDEDFTKIHDALAVFSSHAFGNRKAWKYVHGQINMEDWAGVAE